MKSWRLCTAVVMAVVAVTRSSAASPAFPDVVREQLSLSAAPSCTLCHDNPSGGIGTATTAFASYLRSRGLRAGDPTSLRSALSAAVAERRDSDGDGTTDTDELRAGRDPNPGPGDVEPPAFGCGAHVAPPRIFGEGAGVLAAFAFAVMAARRRRRKWRDD